MVITFRQTYSSILSLTLLNISVTYVIFSTMSPTSCRNWSMVIGRPIILVRHVCNVYMLFETYTQAHSLNITQNTYSAKVCRKPLSPNAQSLFRKSTLFLSKQQSPDNIHEIDPLATPSKQSLPYHCKNKCLHFSRHEHFDSKGA